ncbi:hypothetical protein [Nocardia bhagyanarayanae]|uniref:Glycosyl transferase family 1 n=1 Tax=Nocardia bhagyanarayanae TaxID=1215925 RepID=A0A543FI44_9NOCA|nr:hypothetical protein [Nocardia bhagyanarayanae]TQM33530.1 hypothetical protein FB390_5263 [Nocardia bhagyanarayanae]
MAYRRARFARRRQREHRPGLVGFTASAIPIGAIASTGDYVEPDNDDAVTSALAAAMTDSDPAAYDPAEIRAHATTFAPAAFRARMADIVTQVMDD